MWLSGPRRLVRDALDPDVDEPALEPTRRRARSQGMLLGQETRRPLVAMDPVLQAEWETIGRRGRYFASTDPRGWIRRHVETIQIKTASFGRRRLTIDVQLPFDPALAVTQTGDHSVFWIPVASLSKTPPRSNIDVRDEYGGALALLARDEDAAISVAAIAAAAEDLLASPPSPFLQALLRELVEQDGIAADLALAMAQRALRAEQGGATTEAGHAFDEALRSMAGNSWLWLPLEGRLGGRRVIKFHYDIEFERDRLRPRRPVTRRYLMRAEETGTVHRFDVVDLGDGNPRSAVRRLAARVANATGLAAIELAIQTPYVTGSATYHMQVESPPAVETRGIDLLAQLRPGATVDRWQRDHGVHLYLANAKVEHMLPAVVTLRVGRRGFLTLSWLTALLITTLLWIFESTGAAALVHPEVSATVLLIVPALLTALVVRPGEHPVATRLLFGVRLLVAISGLLAVGAAAAVSNATPSDWSPQHTWFIYAVVCSAVAGFLTLSWVLAWDSSHNAAQWARERWRSRGVYFASCLLLAVLTAAPVTLGWADSAGIRAVPGVYIGYLVVLAALSFFAATTYARLDLPRSAAPIATISALVSALAFSAAAVLLMSVLADWSWKSAWETFSYALWGCLVLLALQELIVRRRRPGDSA